MGFETDDQLLVTSNNKAKFGGIFKTLPRLEQNERESCFARRTIKTLFNQIVHYLAETASFLAFLIAGDNQNPTWLTPIIDLYTWTTFHELVTLRLVNWFEVIQIIASYIPCASVSLITIAAICLPGSPAESTAEKLSLQSILNKMSSAHPESKMVISILIILWTAFTLISVAHYFWKTKQRAASIPEFSMQHIYLTLLKLVAIGADLSFVNTLARAGTKWKWLPFPLIYLLLILVLSFHWFMWGSGWDDELLIEYFSKPESGMKDNDLKELYKAYKKENPDEMYELPTLSERIRNINSNENGEAQNTDNPGGEADQ